MSRFAYLFPGQGAQFPGMGRELFEAVPASRAVFDEADRVLEQDLSGVCFDGPPERLALTETTQPALLTVSVAALAALEARGVRPVAAAGHSLGEYGAHVAAGTIPFDAAVRAVRQRGAFMQQAVPAGQGAMAAILGLDAATVLEVCEQAAGDEIVSPANLNGPRQTVIAGTTAGVERASALALERGARRVIPLKVSAPFHCSLMEPAATALAPVLDAIDFRDPSVPVYTNADAAAVHGGAAARDALLRQVAVAVRWHELIECMLDDGLDGFIEVGPGNVLAGLIRGIRRGVPVLPAGTPDQIDEVARAVGAAS